MVWPHMSTINFLRSGKLIGPGDFLLDGTIEVLAAQRKVERQAAYCLLQALSNQIKHLTGGSKTICSYDYAGTDLELALLNLTPGHLRVVTNDGNGAIRDIFVQDKDKNTIRKIDLSMAHTANILTLGMDQGTSGDSTCWLHLWHQHPPHPLHMGPIPPVLS